MKMMNGLQVFEQGDQLPELPAGLTADLPVVSRFGFKIVQLDGKPVWEAATEEDFRNSEAQRLGIKPEDVVLTLSCYNTGPTSCGGGCDTSATCTAVYHPSDGHYYCGCQP
jgi:hypothetical protein